MKKLFSILIALVMVFAVVFVLTACDGNETYTIALVTDVGTIDDQSFNQGAWEGVVAYAEKFGITYAYYQPAEDTDAARIASIDNAVKKGAKIVVCPGYLFETTLYACQDDYPNVKFILLDGAPNSGGDYITTFPVYKTSDNVHCIFYQEEQAGYLAGYAAVKEGYRKLGFLGGMAVPAVIRYGHGFALGAEAAAVELGLAKDVVELKYTYGGQFYGDADITTAMQGWYSGGTEVVFACGGGIFTSALEGIGTGSGKVIGVDVDQAHIDEKIITSAMKELKKSVEIALAQFFGDNWDEIGGKSANLGAAENCIGLPTATASWRLTTFTVTQYNALFAKLVNGTIVVNNSTVEADIVALLTKVKFTRVANIK